MTPTAHCNLEARVAASTERAHTAGLTPHLELIVYGMPGPQGSKRHVGGGRMIESSAKVKPWRESVKWACIEKGGLSACHVAGAVAMQIVFTLPKPKGAPKKRITVPRRKPDLSKLVRSTEDALTQFGAIEDDAAIVELVTAKRYPNEGPDALAGPGCVIRIWRLQA